MTVAAHTTSFSNTTDAPSELEVPLPRPRRYTPGMTDVFGDRLLMFDDGTATSLELLRFTRELGSAPSFEPSLRTRIDELSRFRHPSVATVRGIETLGGGDGLALVSQHTPGRRLSDMLHDAHGPAFAMELVGQLCPALAALQQVGPGICHGALTAERVIVTREGRLVIVEHVMGSAIQSLSLPARELRARFGLAVPNADDAAVFDSRTDVIQLGFLALSLLLGCRVEPTAYPDQLVPLLDEFTQSHPAASARFRPWLERALQLGEGTFSSAQEASTAFHALSVEIPPTPLPAPAHVAINPVASAGAMAAAVVATRVTDSTPSQLRLAPVVEPTAYRASATQETGVPSEHATTRDHATDGARHTAQSRGWVRWALVGLGGLAAAEALVIAGLFAKPLTGAPALVVVPAPNSAAALLVPSGLPLASIEPRADAPAPAIVMADSPTLLAQKAAEAAQAAARTKADLPMAGAGERFGGLTLSAPIELQVYEGGKLVGSTAGPIAVPEGAHSFELVNDALGFRARETVDVKAGQMANRAVVLPSGRISVNAMPWAEVWIDGTSRGETPLANLALPIGQHDIVFKHPQLGEQRQTAVVKAEGLTRVSANLQTPR